MRTVRNILLIALVLLVQSVYFGRLDIFNVRPDLAMLVLFLIATQTSSAPLLLYGFFIGFLQDVYSPEFLGYNALAMSMTAFFIDVTRERISVENLPVRISLILAACLLHDFIYLIFYTRFDFAVLGRMFLAQSFPGAVYTSALALLLMTLWRLLVKGGVIFVLGEVLGSNHR